MKKIIAVVALGAVAFGGYSYANYYVSKEARKDVDKQLLDLHAQTGLDVRYQELSTDLFNKGVALESVVVNSVEGDKIADIARVEMVGFDPQKVTEHARFTIDGMTLQGAALEGLEDLEGEQINLITEFNYQQSNGDADAQTVIEAGNIADIKFNFAMTNSQELMALSEQLNAIAEQEQNGQATMQQQLVLQSQLMTAMMNLVPKSMSFELKNKGKLKDILERTVTAQGMTLEQFQMHAQQQLSVSPAPVVLREAALGFINGTEQFSVSVTVPEQTTVAQLNQKIIAMADPEELAKYFDLQATGK
ncbi:hypothetical protein AAEU32_08875 [Pseudoalteromonas sp. SSDWG2]|uniref:hypothetical protein n=1 Tax=Pseudoalteromonas sp. SSDWG2 TaxID=3139391 RepID=UPI003BAC775D